MCNFNFMICFYGQNYGIKSFILFQTFSLTSTWDKSFNVTCLYSEDDSLYFKNYDRIIMIALFSLEKIDK